MTRVQNKMRLHESTVKKAASKPVGHKRPRAKGRRLASPVVTLTVDRPVMDAARAIRDDESNSYSRIQIIDATTVVVR